MNQEPFAQLFGRMTGNRRIEAIAARKANVSNGRRMVFRNYSNNRPLLADLGRSEMMRSSYRYAQFR